MLVFRSIGRFGWRPPSVVRLAIISILRFGGVVLLRGQFADPRAFDETTPLRRTQRGRPSPWLLARVSEGHKTLAKFRQIVLKQSPTALRTRQGSRWRPEGCARGDREPSANFYADSGLASVY